MVSLNPPVCDFGFKALDFTLLGVDSKFYSLSDCMGRNGLLVMFICNHCPYVKAVHARILRDTKELIGLGINSVAIMSNDAANYPDDSYENMQRIAKEFNYPFPYLYDETQAIAKAYGAVCTPDFFGYNADFELQYRGRLDASKKDTAPEGTRRDLYEAMKLVAQTGKGPQDQIASIGCSIKWKTDAHD
jgi:peroxiredoxin